MILNRKQPTLDPQTQSNRAFFEILGLGILWASVSLGIAWQYGLELFYFVIHLCQASWDALFEVFPASWHLLVPAVIILLLVRTLWLIIRRLWKTHQFIKILSNSRQPLSSRVLHLISAIGLTEKSLICFEASAGHAFSAGIWQPRIWLSTGLVSLLDDDELTAVLLHEAHHCRQRDPLRLFLSRLISDSFFFVPWLYHLADQTHLAQEMAADAAAIRRLGDSLPLASALHKLLLAVPQPVTDVTIPISQINVTERRILALVSVEHTPRWQPSLWRWGASLLLASLLLSSILLTEPTVQQAITVCTT